jgi:hypothetical protein
MEKPEKDSRNDNPEAEVTLDALCKGDKLTVKTQRSNYQFCVSDPSRRTGTLTGGALGDQNVEAFFAGTISGERTDFDSWELKPGARALFFIDTNNRARRLVTSAVTGVTIVKDNFGEERAA